MSQNVTTTKCRLLMGHAEPGMERFYVLDVSRERVRRVCMLVRSWALEPGGSGDLRRDEVRGA